MLKYCVYLNHYFGSLNPVWNFAHRLNNKQVTTVLVTSVRATLAMQHLSSRRLSPYRSFILFIQFLARSGILHIDLIAKLRPGDKCPGDICPCNIGQATFVPLQKFYSFHPIFNNLQIYFKVPATFSLAIFSQGYPSPQY